VKYRERGRFAALRGQLSLEKVRA